MAANMDLCIDIQSIAGQVQEVEIVMATQTNTIRRAQQVIDTHSLQLHDLNRHMEDLDNRGRCHNLRGLPKTVETDQLQATVVGLFNNHLERTPYIPYRDGENTSHPLTTRQGIGPTQGCNLPFNRYQLKEEILPKAQNKTQISHNGRELCLFQDLSNITLQLRRELRPILEDLHMKGIPYRWKFPFCLSATSQGRTALLRVPEDLHHFCDTLDILLTEIPDWYAKFCPPVAIPTQPRSEPMETHEVHYRRRRLPSETHSHQLTPDAYLGTSPMKALQTRRAHRDH